MFIAYNGKWLSPARSPYPFYIKTLLPNYREFSDIRYFTSLIEVAQERHAFPEDFLSPVQIPFDDGRKFRIGPLICEDSWDENYPFKPMHYLGKMYDIDLFVNVSNSPFTLGKTQRRHRLFGQAIDKIHCPAIYVNCTGIQNNGKNIYTFDGASSTYQKDGSHHSACTPFTEELLIVDFDETTQAFTSPSKVQPESRRSKIFTTASTTASSTLWIPSASISRHRRIRRHRLSGQRRPLCHGPAAGKHPSGQHAQLLQFGHDQEPGQGTGRQHRLPVHGHPRPGQPGTDAETVQ